MKYTLQLSVVVSRLIWSFSQILANLKHIMLCNRATHFLSLCTVILFFNQHFSQCVLLKQEIYGLIPGLSEQLNPFPHLC